MFRPRFQSVVLIAFGTFARWLVFTDQSLNLIGRCSPIGIQSDVAQWEKRLIEHAMEAFLGSKSAATRRLGIHRRLLYDKLQQFGMA